MISEEMMCHCVPKAFWSKSKTLISFWTNSSLPTGLNTSQCRVALPALFTLSTWVRLGGGSCPHAITQHHQEPTNARRCGKERMRAKEVLMRKKGLRRQWNARSHSKVLTSLTWEGLFGVVCSQRSVSGEGLRLDRLGPCSAPSCRIRNHSRTRPRTWRTRTWWRSGCSSTPSAWSEPRSAQTTRA